MPAWLKKEDEGLWAKAKEAAEKEGRAEDYAYVTGIFKRMGGKPAKVRSSEVVRAKDAVQAAWSDAARQAALEAKRAKYPVGSKVRFDGRSADGQAEGFFDVEIVNPHSNEHDVAFGEGKPGSRGERMYNKQGITHLPTATVKSLRTGKVFEAYHHTLRGGDFESGESIHASCAAKLVAYMAGLRDAHWQADTKSEEHETLGALYDALDPLVDRFVEVKAGRDGGKPEDATGEVVADVKDDPVGAGLAAVEEARGEAEGADDLLNVLAEMEGELMKAKYLLKAKGTDMSDKVTAVGTSEGAKKGWDQRKGLAHYFNAQKSDPSKNHQEAEKTAERAANAYHNAGLHNEGQGMDAIARYHRAVGTHKMDHDKAVEYAHEALWTAKASESIHCRASFSDNSVKEKSEWRQGEPVAFCYMPEGTHTVTAGFRNGSIRLTVKVDEDTAKACQESLEAIRVERPRQTPYGCVEHREQEASVIGKGFEWESGKGVVLTAEPTALGASNVNGKVHWSWSPSFTTDAEYHRAACDCGTGEACKCSKPVLVFDRGARGSEQNPARVTGVDFVLGTLTNRPAFREMPAVTASDKSDAVKTVEDTATRSEAAKKGWEHRQHKYVGDDGQEHSVAFAPGDTKEENKAFHAAQKAIIKHGHNNYTESIPVQEHADILEKHGFSGNALDGIYTGREGHADQQIGPNTFHHMAWYKMPSGRYETTAYLSHGKSLGGGWKYKGEQQVEASDHSDSGLTSSGPVSSDTILASLASRKSAQKDALRAALRAKLGLPVVKAAWSDAARQAALEQRKRHSILGVSLTKEALGNFNSGQRAQWAFDASDEAFRKNTARTHQEAFNEHFIAGEKYRDTNDHDNADKHYREALKHALRYGELKSDRIGERTSSWSGMSGEQRRAMESADRADAARQSKENWKRATTGA